MSSLIYIFTLVDIIHACFYSHTHTNTQIVEHNTVNTQQVLHSQSLSLTLTQIVEHHTVLQQVLRSQSLSHTHTLTQTVEHHTV